MMNDLAETAIIVAVAVGRDAIVRFRGELDEPEEKVESLSSKERHLSAAAQQKAIEMAPANPRTLKTHAHNVKNAYAVGEEARRISMAYSVNGKPIRPLSAISYPPKHGVKKPSLMSLGSLRVKQMLQRLRVNRQNITRRFAAVRRKPGVLRRRAFEAQPIPLTDRLREWIQSQWTAVRRIRHSSSQSIRARLAKFRQRQQKTTESVHVLKPALSRTERFKLWLTYFGLRKNRTIPLSHKIRERHLELEPLCCISSCLVRGGCMAVVVFETMYILLTLFVICYKFYAGGRIKLWEPFEPNFNSFVTHQAFLYIVVWFDLVSCVMVLALLRGLLRFERALLRIHLRYDYMALVFNICFFVTYALALSSEGPETWTLENIILVCCFAVQIPLQLWAISVVKSCYDFFVLLYVFVSLAEK
ncbi:Protein C45G9.11 [Aphelenchoides avenae]|nr:Protein C45G9.11 [Aphelenchus avenae]